MYKKIEECEVWLKCEEIREGMFKTEKFIKVRDLEGKLKGGFFPDGMIKNGALRVIVLKKKGNKFLVTAASANGMGFFDGSTFWVDKQAIVNKN